jgi:hypothetical protein
LVKRCGSLAGLLEELTRAEAETADLLAELPESFTQRRRHLYRRAALWVMEVTPGHLNDEHAAQIQATLEAARKS